MHPNGKLAVVASGPTAMDRTAVAAPGPQPSPHRRALARPVVSQGKWLSLLCLTLLGYALAGKGWAYIGLPPVFIGEVVLFSGVIGVVLFGRFTGILDLPPVWCLVAL